VVCGVAAAVHAGDQAAPAVDAGECPQSEMVTEIPAPAEALGSKARLPRRRRISAVPDTPRDGAELPGLMDEGPSQGVVPARPDLDVLAQVLRGLQRLA
jgi:hypothetical protein